MSSGPTTPSVFGHLRETYGCSALVWIGIVLTAGGQLIFKVAAPVAVIDWAVGLISTGGDWTTGLARLSLLYALAIALELAGSYLFIRQSDDRYEVLVGRFHDKVVKMPVDFFRRVKAGTLSTLFRNHLDGTINLFRLLRVEVIPLIIATAVPAIVLGAHALAVGLLFGSGVLLRGYFTIRVASSLKQLRKAALRVYGELSGEMSDQMAQMPVVLASAQVPLARKKVTALARDEARLFWARHKAATLFDAAGNLITALCFVATLGAVAVASGLGTQERLRLLAMSMVFITQALQAISGLAELHQRWSERWEHVALSLRELDSGTIPDPNKQCRSEMPSAGTIELNGVTFTYPHEQPSLPILNDVTLSIPDGAHVAILGPNGAGKSTLVNLILRFDIPTAGEISVGGVNTTECNAEGFYETISYVPQDIRLFNTTLRENLFLFEPKASQERADTVFEITGIKALAKKLPEGLDTVVGEAGARISGGERQRVTLARALLRDARIYVLDEPTSAIRGKDSIEVIRRITQFLHGRTVVLITHSESVAEILPNQIEIKEQSARWIRKAW